MLQRSEGLHQAGKLQRSKLEAIPKLDLCDSLHEVCSVDFMILPELATISGSDNDTRYDRCLHLRAHPPKIWRFHHIPKNAGKAVEKFLGSHWVPVGNNLHMGFRKLNPPWDAKAINVVVLRHPIERMVSYYYFLKKGLHQTGWQHKQEHFCKPGTGGRTKLNVSQSSRSTNLRNKGMPYSSLGTLMSTIQHNHAASPSALLLTSCSNS